MAHNHSLGQFDTPEARTAYARRLRDFAAWCLVIHNYSSAALNIWMAENYERPVDSQR